MSETRKTLRICIPVLGTIILLYFAGLLLTGSESVLNTVWSSHKDVLIPLLPFAIFLIIILWVVPKIHVSSLCGAKGVLSEFEREKERLTLEDSSRKTLAEILGGVFVILGLVITYNTYLLSQEGQRIERYSKASLQLESENMQTRTGALHALEQLAVESSAYHWKTMEAVSSFVRQKAARPEVEKNTATAPLRGQTPPSPGGKSGKVEDDIQLALNIIGKRKSGLDPPEKVINLRGTALNGADLTGLDFSRAKLDGADLSNAVLAGTKLAKTSLTKAVMREVVISKADLTEADLTSADMTEATLTEVDLSGAELFRIIINDADFRGALNLMFEQIQHVTLNDNTKLPDPLEVYRGELSALQNSPNP